MSGWHGVRLVAAREVQERLRSRTFVFSTLFFLAVVAATIAIPVLLHDDSPPGFDVAVVGPAAAELVAAVPSERARLVARPAADVRAAESLVRADEVDAALAVGDDGALRLTGLRDVPAALSEALRLTARDRDVRAAVGKDADALLAGPDVEARLLDDRGLAGDLSLLLTLAFGLLFFSVVYQFGNAIAQSVVQEKESRVVEILVAAVPVRTLLWGKVLGNGGLALAQVLLLATVAAVGVALTGDAEVLGLLLRGSAWFVLFFALGFLMLSCLWAAAGAFAARTEDLQSTTMPLQLVLLAPLFAAVYVPEGGLRTALSFVPLSAPLTMPTRVVAGDAAVWEALLSAAAVLGTALVAVRVGERLYRSSLLNTRSRTSLRSAWSGQPRSSARR